MRTPLVAAIQFHLPSLFCCCHPERGVQSESRNLLWYRPHGTQVLFTHVHPALKRWAKLFRPRAGSCVVATNVSHCGIQALALPVIVSGGGPLSAAGVEGPLLRTLTAHRSLSHTVRLTPAPQPHSTPVSG